MKNSDWSIGKQNLGKYYSSEHPPSHQSKRKTLNFNKVENRLFKNDQSPKSKTITQK